MEDHDFGFWHFAFEVCLRLPSEDLKKTIRYISLGLRALVWMRDIRLKVIVIVMVMEGVGTDKII